MQKFQFLALFFTQIQFNLIQLRVAYCNLNSVYFFFRVYFHPVKLRVAYCSHATIQILSQVYLIQSKFKLLIEAVLGF